MLEALIINVYFIYAKIKATILLRHRQQYSNVTSRSKKKSLYSSNIGFKFCLLKIIQILFMV